MSIKALPSLFSVGFIHINIFLYSINISLYKHIPVVEFCSLALVEAGWHSPMNPTGLLETNLPLLPERKTPLAPHLIHSLSFLKISNQYLLYLFKTLLINLGFFSDVRVQGNSLVIPRVSGSPTT